MKWYVSVKCDHSNFFATVSPGKYFSGIVMDYEGGCRPAFMPSDPTAYPRRSASFLVRELRRVGYNVHRRPWILYALHQRRNIRKQSPWKR